METSASVLLNYINLIANGNHLVFLKSKQKQQNKNFLSVVNIYVIIKNIFVEKSKLTEIKVSLIRKENTDNRN